MVTHYSKNHFPLCGNDKKFTLKQNSDRLTSYKNEITCEICKRILKIHKREFKRTE